MAERSTSWAGVHGDELVAQLRQMADAYPADLFPPDGTSRDAIAGTTMRRVAAPALRQAADEIERLRAAVARHEEREAHWAGVLGVMYGHDEARRRLREVAEMFAQAEKWQP